MRENDPEVDVLLAQLKQQLSSDRADTQIEIDRREPPTGGSGIGFEELADLIAQRIWAYLEEHVRHES